MNFYFLISFGRKILPKGKLRRKLGRKMKHWITVQDNRSIWGTTTNMPLQSKEYVDLTLSLLEKCAKNGLEGDVIECGVYKGGNSFQIAKRLKKLNLKKKLYALDTFEGHPYDDYHNMPEELRKSVYGDSTPKKFMGTLNNVDLDHIKKWFVKEKLDNTIFLKGIFENTFKSLSDKKFCFAYVDCDSYLSVKQCIEFLKGRMVVGGIIMFDDYNFPECPGCNKAVDDILGKSSLTILEPVRAYWIKKASD